MKKKFTACLFLFPFPLITLGLILSVSSKLGNFDYWNIIISYHFDKLGGTEYKDLLFTQNGHNFTVPGYLEIINYYLTSGNAVFLSLLTWLFALSTAVILLNTLKPKAPKLDFYLITLITGFFFFSPAAIWNFLEGHSGLGWQLSNLLSVSALLLLIKYKNKQAKFLLICSITCLLLGNFTYSSSFPMWLVLILLSSRLFLNIKSAFLSYLFFFIMMLLFQYLFIEPERITLAQKVDFVLVDRLAYVPAYVGSVLSESYYQNLGWGVLFLLLFFGLATKFYKQKKQTTAYLIPLALGLFSLGNALASLIFRFNWNANPDLSRYASLPSIFILSSCLLLLLDSRKSRQFFVYLFCLLLIVKISYSSIPEIERNINLQNGKNLATLAIVNQVNVQVVSQITFKGFSVRNINKVMKELKHYPFHDKEVLSKFSYPRKADPQNDWKEVKVKPELTHLAPSVFHKKFSFYFPKSTTSANFIYAVNQQNQITGIALRENNPLSKKTTFTGYQSVYNYDKVKYFLAK